MPLARPPPGSGAPRRRSPPRRPAASCRRGQLADSGGSTTCNDCGNQAKKDCPHQRCRTCCKSRGFDCTTHVRSTWIPAAARRREKQPLGGDLSPPAAPAMAATKKPQLHSSQTTTTTTTSRTSTSNGTSSSQQDAPFRDSLPRHVRAPAVFRCVRLTSVDDGANDGADEFAYKAAVSINGHMFWGFLYDQDADNGRTSNDEPSHAHAAADAPFRDSLPRRVRAPAVFRFVRITSVDEIAYHAAVSINGHMFRGFLFHQCADNGHASNDEPSHAHAAAVRSISDLHLGNASAVPPDMYNTVSGALILGGLGYGNTMN